MLESPLCVNSPPRCRMPSKEMKGQWRQGGKCPPRGGSAPFNLGFTPLKRRRSSFFVIWDLKRCSEKFCRDFGSDGNFFVIWDFRKIVGIWARRKIFVILCLNPKFCCAP